ncbi:MAG: CBS domain-containing protein [Anaerolineae bacterium]|nr:CBS domain-containing protein [Anaerolineae bacterium]
MHYGVITVSANTPVNEVARRMASYRIHAIVVVDEDGYAIGIVSQTDIVLARQGNTPEQMARLTAADIMTRRLITCTPQTKVSEAITLMTRNRIHRLVVVDERRGKLWPIGILSQTDIINYGLEMPTMAEESGTMPSLAEVYEPTPPRPSKLVPPKPAPVALTDESTVADVMHHGVISCHPDTSVAEIAHRLLANRISAVIVVDHEGFLTGIVSQTDLVMARLGRTPEQLAALTAADILTHEVITCTPATRLSEAITLMTRNRIHRLVVVEERDGRPWPIGVVSMTDIVRQTLGGTEPVADEATLSYFGVDPI